MITNVFIILFYIYIIYLFFVIDKDSLVENRWSILFDYF